MDAQKTLDLVSVGSVTVDLTQNVSHQFLADLKVPAGDTRFLSKDEFEKLSQSKDIHLKSIGGPSTNIVTSLSMTGMKTGLIAKLSTCDYGQFYKQEIEKFNIDYTPVISTENHAKVLMSYVTPDKERSFVVREGGCSLGVEDIDFLMLSQARYVHLDLFLMETERGTQAAHLIRKHVLGTGGKLIIGLNSEGFVDYKRADILKCAVDADIIVASMGEFKTLYSLKTDEEVFEKAKQIKATVALTQGAKRAYVIEGQNVHEIEIPYVANVIDTCGAGDQFAAGFIKGMMSGLPADGAGAQGVAWAQKIIQHAGALPQAVPPVVRKPANRNEIQNKVKAKRRFLRFKKG